MPNDQYIQRKLAEAIKDTKTAATPQGHKRVKYPSATQLAKDLEQYFSAPISFADPETETLADRAAVPPNSKFVAKTTHGNKFLQKGKVQAFFVDAPTASINTVLTDEHAAKLQAIFSRKTFM